ncbi:hypothetical protein DL771_005486 [Monosporascus sp. 5C6A]|nr:hypothetical protein DL771_005486 [Monosporascus sp. 5C6A]
MDHISRPGNPSLPHIQVPYVCGHLAPCTPASFLEWLAGAPAWFAANRADPLDVFVAKLQNQLYFGLLAAFLCRDVHRADFVRVDKTGGSTLDSAAVQNALQEWSQAWKANSAPFFHSSAMRSAYEGYTNAREIYDLYGRESPSVRTAYSCSYLNYTKVRDAECCGMLRRTWNIVSMHVMAYLAASDVDEEQQDFWANPAYAVLFSIDVLMDQLETYLLPSNFVRDFGSRDLRRFPLVAGFEPFRRSLLKNGRCPSLVWRLQLSATDYYRLLFLPAPSSSGGPDHASCTYRQCTRFDRPETKHRDGCEGCDFVKSDLDTVIKCINEGSIPLINFEEDGSGRVRISTVVGGLRSDFTAISHVWAGGLGNQVRNALPQCQLQYILESVTGMPPAPDFSAAEFLYETVNQFALSPEDMAAAAADPLAAMGVKKRRRQALVWIDSLCVPADPNAANQERINKAKEQAINRMAQLYAGAEKVLVLDPELRQLPSVAGAEDVNILSLYIRISPWMARSWPLQEGALGQNVYFQFKDRSILLEELVGSLAGLPSMKMAKYYRKHKEGGYRKGAYGGSRSLLEQTWNSLVNRSTTKFEDLPAILAVMMESSAEEVLRIAAKWGRMEAMKALLGREKFLPLALLYQPNTSMGGQWVPDFPGADQRQTFVHSYYGTLKRSEKGFLLQNRNDTAFVIVPDIPDGGHFILQLGDAEGNTTYAIRQRASVPARGINQSLKTVFLLSRLCGVEASIYHGARFSIATEDETELRLQFETDVLWNDFGTRTPADSGVTYTKCEMLEDQEASGKKRLVYIDLHHESWPSLTWERNVALPIRRLVDDGIIRGVAASTLSVMSQILLPLIYPSLKLRISVETNDLGLHGTSFAWVWSAFVILRTMTFFNELVYFAYRTTRNARTLWAASFYEAASLPTKLLSFEENTSMQATPFYVPSRPIGAALLLGWVKFEADWMIIWGVLQLAERPAYQAWRVILRRVGLFSRENLDRWWASDGTKRLVVEAVASTILLVIPAIFAGSWILIYKDGLMAVPHIILLCAYAVWYRYDFGAVYAKQLADAQGYYMILLPPVFGWMLLMSPVSFIMFGVRYDSTYLVWLGVSGLCMISAGAGYYCSHYRILNMIAQRIDCYFESKYRGPT